MRKGIIVSIILCVGCMGLLFFQNRAHPEEEENGGLIIFSKPVKGVYFSHKEHADFSCEDCHEGIFALEVGVAEASGHFTMRLMEEGETCGACHDGDTAFSVKESCTKCHIGVLGVKRLREEQG